MWLSSAAGVLLALAGSVVADTPPPVLEPNGPWVVEGSEGACILTRSYGPDAGKITVGIQPLFNTPTVELVVLMRDTERWAGQGEAGIAFGGEPIAGTYNSYPIGNQQRLTRLRVPAAILDRVKAAPAMTLTARGLSATVRLARTQAAFAGFDGCQRLLFQKWNVDPAMLAGDRSPTAINAEAAYGPEAYPEAAARIGQQGRVITVLDISAAGRVTGCRVVVAAEQSLDKATCFRAKRIKFIAGKDAAGQVKPSTYILPVRWVLPDG